MQQPTRNTPNKKTKYLDAKVLIATLSVAVTFSLWNIFSNEAVQAEKASPAKQLSVPSQPPANAAEGFPPLPTLVPLTNGNPVSAQAAPVVTQPNGQNNSQATGLRSVTAPSQVIQQKNKPLIDAPVLVTSGGGGGGNSSGGSAPVTSTQSSRK